MCEFNCAIIIIVLNTVNVLVACSEIECNVDYSTKLCPYRPYVY